MKSSRLLFPAALLALATAFVPGYAGNNVGNIDIIPADSVVADTVPAPPVDSLEAAMARIFGDNIRAVLHDMSTKGINVDAGVTGQYIAAYLGQGEFPLTKEAADSVYRSVVSELTAPKEITPEQNAAALEKASKAKGATTLPSGVVIQTIVPGDGKVAGSTDRVFLKYTGRLADGSIFDQIMDTEAAEPFRVNELTPGLSQALQALKAGGRYRVTIPASEAYGDDGIPGAIPPGATLIFELEIVK